MEVLLVLLGLGFVFGPWVVAIVALVGLGRLRARVDVLERALAADGAQAEAPTAAAESPSPETLARVPRFRRGVAAAGHDTATDLPPAGSAPGTAAPDVLAPDALAPDTLAPDTLAPADAGAEPAEPVNPPPGLDRAAARTGMEEALASRWMVWLGAVAVALSAVFLFVWAVEQGWLGPVARVGLGLALGAALIAGAERLRVPPAADAARQARPDMVAPALAASGAFALFASVYAAHGLYDLLGPALAFTLLGAVSLGAMALALRHGLGVAALGLAGGYAVPMLVAEGTPQAAPVFLYLAVLTAACLVLMRLRPWWFLGPVAVAGGLGWAVLWMAWVDEPADRGVIGLYAVVLAAAFAAFGRAWPVVRAGERFGERLATILADTGFLGFVASGAVLVLMALGWGYDAGAFLLVGAHAAVGLGIGRWRAAREPVALAAAMVTALAMLWWPPPFEAVEPVPLPGFDPPVLAFAYGAAGIPGPFLPFARALLALALLFGAGGVLALRGAARPGLWAGIGAAMPVVLLALGYWRIGGFRTDIGWGLVAGALALALAGAAGLADRWMAGPGRNAALGAFAAGAAAALALGLACVLRAAWLTVALALLVPVLVELWSRLSVPALRLLAGAAAGVVLVRLVLNPWVLDYGGGLGPFGWVLWGYGVPAAAFLLAARRLGTDPLALPCRAAAAGLGFLMVALQLRLWTGGSLAEAPWGLLDAGVQSLWWLVAATLLLRGAGPVWIAGAVLLGAAAVQLGLGHLIAMNPLLTGEAVGDWPGVNLLGLGYLAPALALGWLAREGRVRLGAEWRLALSLGAFALGFVWLTLETRRAFQGSVVLIDGRATTGGEIYAYSAVWIVAALGLLAVGILRGEGLWRKAALAVLAVTVLKVFLYDMGDLTGLLRVASFLGLGLALIGLGFLYRRFVFADGEATNRAR